MIILSILLLLAVTRIVVCLIRNWRNVFHIFEGLFCFDTRLPRHGVLQALTRFTWELPTTIVGCLVAQFFNIICPNCRVDHFGGITYLTLQNSHRYMGVSLGSYIVIFLPGKVAEPFDDSVLADRVYIFQHEYGHTFDSQRFGWFYLPVVGLSSLISVLRSCANHSDFWTERRADRFAAAYFGRLKNNS